MNRVELCNLALGRIGQGASKPIQSIDGTDTSEAARVAQRVFPHAMETVLSEYPWPFAISAAALAAVPQVVPGWDYVYAYPNNCLNVLALSDAYSDPMRAAQSIARVPFKIVQNLSGEGRVIATDLPEAYAWYTVSMLDPAFGDALFRDALAWRLAMEFALGLKADPRMAQAAGPAYTLALSKAIAKFSNEAGVEREPDVESVRAYGGTTYEDGVYR